MSFDNTCLSIIIPTYKRPDMLARALASVETEAVDGLDIEIVIADNDPQASAKDFMTQKIANSEANIVYIHVPISFFLTMTWKPVRHGHKACMTPLKNLTPP